MWIDSVCRGEHRPGRGERLVESGDLVVELKLIDGASNLANSSAGAKAKSEEMTPHQKWWRGREAHAETIRTIKEKLD